MKNSRLFSILATTVLMLQTWSGAQSKPETTEKAKNGAQKVEQTTKQRRPPKVTNLPQAWQTLKTAKQFSSATVGEAAAPSKEYQAFLAVAPLAGSHRGEIDSLIREGSPAGKLYGASLLYAVDHKAGLAALNKLADSQEKVTYRSGCEIMNETAGAIARSLLKTGRFMDWTLGAK
ncbi:MAG TPA: hypothetical protein PK671_06515 [Candidatus Obscuribacter sp.]|nr:hypothetical protein [Candidatus Obscuribacter sp.]